MSARNEETTVGTGRDRTDCPGHRAGYGLPLKLREVMIEAAGRCTVGFSDSYSGAATVSVGIWCDAKVSPHGVRESLKKGLQVAD